ncbi:MAG: hypothetical protein ACOZAR_04040 [Patescibacteria group bacterium]
MEILNHLLPILDIAHAAEPDADKITQSFFGLVNWIAGITILIAAIYLPFQIGGIGQSIINGFGKIYKTGVDAGKSVTDKAGKFAYHHMGGKEFLDQAKAKYISPIIAGTEFQKKKWTDDAKKMNRQSMIGAGIAASRKDDKLWLDVSRNTDKDAQGRYKYQEDVSSIEKKIRNDVTGSGEWDNFNSNDKAYSGKMQEDATNLFLTLREWSRNPGSFPDKYKEAQGVLDKWKAMGFDFDSYGNFRKMENGKGTDKGKGDPNDPHLLNSLLKDGGLDNNHLEKIRTATNDQDIINLIAGIKDKPAGLDSQINQIFTQHNKDNPTQQINTLQDLALHYNNNIKTELNKDYDKYTSMLQNTPSDVLTNINNALKQDKIKEALELANLHNVRLVQEKIKTLPKDYMGNYLPSLDSYLFKHSFQNYNEGRSKIDNEIKVRPNVTIDTLTTDFGTSGTMNDPAALKIIERYKKTQNYLSTDPTLSPVHNSVQTSIDNLQNATIQDKIEAVMKNVNLSEGYAKELFNNNEIVARIMDARKNSQIKYNSLTTGEPDEYDINQNDIQNIMAKIQKIDENYDQINKKFLIYNK